MPLDVLNTILPPSAAECEDSSLVHPFQPPASSRALLSGSRGVYPSHRPVAPALATRARL